MNLKPLVSVIIPTYNNAHLIGKAIKSVLNQTYDNFEIIIINNFSKDNTIEVVNSFCDVRIKLINFNNNGQIGLARNIGMQNSIGDLIAFLDSDDVWYTNKLEKSISIMMNQEVDVFCHNMMVVQSGKKPFVMYCGPKERAAFQSLIFDGNCMILSASIISRKVFEKIGGFTTNKEMINCEDYDYWIRASKQGFNFEFINEVLGEYLLHSGNTSNNINQGFLSAKNIVEHHYVNSIIVKNLSNRIRLRKVISIFLYSAGRNSYSSNRKKEALSYFLRSILKFPLNFKPYVLLVMCIFSSKYTDKFILKIFLNFRNTYFALRQKLN